MKTQLLKYTYFLIYITFMLEGNLKSISLFIYMLEKMTSIYKSIVIFLYYYLYLFIMLNKLFDRCLTSFRFRFNFYGWCFMSIVLIVQQVFECSSVKLTCSLYSN